MIQGKGGHRGTRLGANPKGDWVEINWPLPSTRVERFTGLAIVQYVTVAEGQGKKI